MRQVAIESFGRDIKSDLIYKFCMHCVAYFHYINETVKESSNQFRRSLRNQISAKKSQGKNDFIEGSKTLLDHPNRSENNFVAPSK